MPRRFAVTSLVLLSVSCVGSQARQYELRGQVIAIDPATRQIVIRHDEIPGYMPAMTMPFKVNDESLLRERVPGDLVQGTLVVTATDGYLASLRKIGFAEIAPTTGTAPSAASGFELVAPGEPVPDGQFIDQANHPRTLAAWRGKAVAVTFIYTRCPFPTFCPLMDRHFKTVQDAIDRDDLLRGRVHLVSISFDPAYDNPTVLSQHAKRLGARPEIWSFLTGDRDGIDRFGARLGVSIMRNPADPTDIAHNLRTAIVDPEGRLRKIYTGNEWTPDQLLADLRSAAGS
jgi:protein SCO1/2